MMQIKAILLYNRAGEIRRINFHLNKVNIITGKSKTGKSSIINIINYCLGRDTFQVAAGVIQDSVEWYAVLYQLNELEVLIAKQRPEHGQVKNDHVYFEFSSTVTIPQITDLVANSNDKAVIDELSRRIGISPNMNIPPEGQSRDPLVATLRHTEFYLFQPQSVIASRDVLFYRQSEPFMAQSIKDTMNYFLGVVQEDRLKLIHQLNDKKRALRLARREFDETNDHLVERANRGISLVVEAQQVGLLSSELQPQTFEDALELLRSLRGWQPTLVISATPDDRLHIIQEEVSVLRRAFQDTLGQIQAAELYVRSADGYSREASEQTSRLESIELFDSNISMQLCPLCGSHLIELPSTVQAINRSLRHLQSDLDVVVREKPELDAHINTLKASLEDIRRQLNQKDFDMEAIIGEQQAAAEIRNTNAQIARVIGRISYYLDITPILDSESAELARKVEQLQREVDDLENQLDTENIETRRTSILNIISNKMTELSEQLDIDEGPYRLEWNKLTVVVDRPIVPIIMNQNMGSAANHLGSHLVALLALQWYFITQHRPVPTFLVFDQPTQVYFPPDVYENVVGFDDIADEDREAVRKIFNLFFKFSAETGLQIIVLDHANLNTPEFQEAVVDNVWRGDNALIPSHWIIEQDE